MVPVFHKLSPEKWSLQWFALPKNKFLRAMVSIVVPLAQKHPHSSDVYDCPFFQKHTPEEWSLQWFALPINISQGNDVYNGSFCPGTPPEE